MSDQEALRSLHPWIADAAADGWAIGNYRTAVEEAWIAIAREIQSRSGSGKDGSKLVSPLCGEDTPLWLVDLSADDAMNTQRGVGHLLLGMAALRNSLAHPSDISVADSRESALEALTTLSLCARYVSNAVRPERLEGLVERLVQLPARATETEIEEALSAIPASARHLVASRLAARLVADEDPRGGGARPPFVHLVTVDAASARSAAAVCAEVLADEERQPRAIRLLSLSVFDALEPADRGTIPRLLAQQLDSGEIVGHSITEGAATLGAILAVWRRLGPGGRHEIQSAMAFGLRRRDNYPGQAYLCRLGCRLLPELADEDALSLAALLTDPVGRRNAWGAADELVDHIDRIPDSCRTLVERRLQHAYAGAPNDASRRVLEAIAAGRAVHARAS
jgi:uncharacterized protein (TIGR02391 family)